MTDELFSELQDLVTSPAFAEVRDRADSLRPQLFAEQNVFPHINCLSVGMSGLEKVVPRLPNETIEGDLGPEEATETVPEE